MKVYVSGPISGYDHGNEPAFRRAARELADVGYDVVIPHDVAPHEHDASCPLGYAKPHVGPHVKHTSTACFIRGDLEALLRCDAIYMLNAWERSVGARAEFEVAAVAGLHIYYQFAPNLVARRDT